MPAILESCDDRSASILDSKVDGRSVSNSLFTYISLYSRRYDE